MQRKTQRPRQSKEIHTYNFFSFFSLSFLLLFISQQSEGIDYNPNKFQARKTARRRAVAPQQTRSRPVTSSPFYLFAHASPRLGSGYLYAQALCRKEEAPRRTKTACFNWNNDSDKALGTLGPRLRLQPDPRRVS